MNNIVLIGMPGCGKSTTGVILAKTAGKSFVDLDLVIQDREGDLLQNLIDRNGMEKFLIMEEEAMRSYDGINSVIATGGSAVYSAKGMAHLSGSGIVVYLALPYETIEERLHNIHTRGIAMGPGMTLQDLYEKRVPLYMQYADVVIDAEGLSVEETVELILDRLGKSALQHPSL